ncbi:unnamed protein product [Bemisia tabaci]|uniref:Uncharacterized protein n=1 Tax=Bemisia tabaci TaxID=7038 RepID=A0A9P0FAF1_BEMTA|nr:unnamed protein product [Bemisia tabaci]
MYSRTASTIAATASNSFLVLVKSPPRHPARRPVRRELRISRARFKQFTNFETLKYLSPYTEFGLKKPVEANITMSTPKSTATLISKCMVFPARKSDVESLKLSMSDISRLALEYIQIGVLLPHPPGLSFDRLLTSLKESLSTTLAHFSPLAGRLATTPDGQIRIACNDAGVEFLAMNNAGLSVDNVLCPGDVPDCVKGFFTYDEFVNYEGHSKPLAAVQSGRCGKPCHRMGYALQVGKIDYLTSHGETRDFQYTDSPKDRDKIMLVSYLINYDDQ